jgi:hypothetical protein
LQRQCSMRMVGRRVVPFAFARGDGGTGVVATLRACAHVCASVCLCCVCLCVGVVGPLLFYVYA